MRRPARWAWLALVCLAALPALAETGPPAANRIYALQGAEALLPLPARSCAAWQLRDEGGRLLREAMPGAGVLALPPGGWYRLHCLDAAGRAEAVGGRFAAGLVVLVTGQSQADALFFAGAPALGAFAAGPAEPPVPEPSAVLHDCAGRPGCGPSGVAWRPAGEALGARLLLAGLAERLPGLPLGLVAASWGGADAAALADAHRPPGERLQRLAAAAAPLSVALILAHGTSDSLQGTPPLTYKASLGEIVARLRGFGPPGMPVLQAPLPPLAGPVRLLGSARLAAWLPFATRPGWAWRLGLVGRSALPHAAAAQAEAIRAAQARAAIRFGLAEGGEMSGIAPGLDGVHWSAEGVRQATREAARALAATVTAR